MSLARSLVVLAGGICFVRPLLLAAASSPCEDTNGSCSHWASIGECDKNPAYMLPYCRKSCGTCDVVDNCPTWTAGGLCESNPAHMYEHCPSTSCDFTAYLKRVVERACCGVNQDVSDVWWLGTAHVEGYIEDVKNYMEYEVWARPQKYTTGVRNACVNKNNMCTHWALNGRCNEVDVKMRCGPSCLSCDFLDDDVRCGGPVESLPNALRPGDLSAMFKRITSSPGSEFAKYNPTIRSQPTDMSNESIAAQDHAPWIVTFDNFLSDEEVDRLLAFGRQTGYEQSHETFSGNHAGRKLTKARTSSNSWCGFQYGDKCFEDPVVKGLLLRMSRVTSVPVPNFNEIQLLHYNEGQYYRTHGDYIVEDEGRREGGRILTFFLYLSDVEEGGETEFPRLKPAVKIRPKKGRAALWANVLDSDPEHSENLKAWHQALPVVRGEKYAANSWIHMRDFRTPKERKC